MDAFIDELFSLQRDDIKKIGKLGQINKEYLKDRIIAKTNISELLELHDNDFDSIQNECWIWNGVMSDKTSKGRQHGQVYYDGKNIHVHRLMFHNFIDDVPEFKKLPDQKQVNHTCSHENNGRCVNPWHMYLGTQKQNFHDSIREGTAYLKGNPNGHLNGGCKNGAENHKAKLSDDKIKEILELKDSGMSQYEVAKLYGVNQSQICRYWKGETRVKYIKVV